MDPDQLRDLGPFAQLEEQARTRMAEHLQVRSVPAGTDLLVQGQPVAGLAVLLDGRATVRRDVRGRTRELAVIGRGATIGELSLLSSDLLASATVTADADLDVMAPAPGCDHLLLDDPTIGPQIRAVARRRLATNRVAELDPVRIELADGTAVDLRPLWPDDWRLMDAGRDRTSRQSLYQRFFSTPKLTETLLRRLATVDFVDDFAWIALDTSGTPDPSDDLLAVGRYARLANEPSVAEVALLVADDWQGRGLGTRVLVALAVAAEEHGVASFEAVALATNRGIRSLLAAAGATWRSDPTDRAHVVARWPVADAIDRLGPLTDVAALRQLVRSALRGVRPSP